MLDFDQQMNAAVKCIEGRYFRYCDDLLFIVPSSQQLDVEGLVFNQLGRIGLSVNSKKTERSTFYFNDGALVCDRSIQYLGFIFDGKRACIRTSSISRYVRRMRASVRLANLTRNKFNAVREKKGLPKTKLYRKTLLERFSHTGDSNFITYGFRAARILNSPTIRGQMKKMTNLLEKELN
jgi:hypothetical protein